MKGKLICKLFCNPDARLHHIQWLHLTVRPNTLLINFFSLLGLVTFEIIENHSRYKYIFSITTIQFIGTKITLVKRKTLNETLINNIGRWTTKYSFLSAIGAPILNECCRSDGTLTNGAEYNFALSDVGTVLWISYWCIEIYECEAKKQFENSTSLGSVFMCHFYKGNLSVSNL